MLLTLLSTALGGGGALLTNLIKVLTDGAQDKRDKSHELSMYNLQLDSAKLQASATVETAKQQADSVYAQMAAQTIDNATKSENWLVAFLNGIIRPVTTICFTVAFFFFMYAVYTYCANKNLPPNLILELPVFITFDNLLTCIISFWYLNRQLGR